MEYILNGILSALKLLFSFNKELYSVIFLSLMVSGVATIIASIISLPIGILLGISSYPLKPLVGRSLYTFMSIPSVLVGLLVAILLSRNGALGFLGLMYSKWAMIIAQTFLLIPLLVGLFFNMAMGKGKKITDICKVLGGNKFNQVLLVITESKSIILIGIVTGFSRAISEVGAVSIVGGNIQGMTRVMTTSIILYQNMGNTDMAIGLGIILLLVSFIVNSFLYNQEKY